MGQLLNVLCYLLLTAIEVQKKLINVVPHTHLGIQVLTCKGCRPYGA